MKKICISDSWYFKNVTDGTEYELIDLPHDYQISSERETKYADFRSAFYPDKSGKYVKHLKLSSKKHYILDVDGSYNLTAVWLNENFLYRHTHGYTPFLVELSEYALDGITNKLVITTNPIPFSTRWYSGNGIYRDVFLWEGGEIRIMPRDIFVTTADVKNGTATVDVAYKITSDRAAKVSVKLVAEKNEEAVAEANEDRILTAGESGEFHATLTIANAELWSPDTPELYTLRVKVCEEDEVVDESEIAFGIRTLSYSAKTGLLLNGKAIKLRGGNVHHDHGDLGAAAYPAAEERKVRILKEAGFNAIRTSHNPPSSALLNACDKLGMIVMDEAFDMWNHPKNKFDYQMFFKYCCLHDIKAMVMRDRAHPSVFSYSIGNEILEIAGVSRSAEISRMLADEIRKYDTTRPVTSGIQKDFFSRPKSEDIDPEDYSAYIKSRFNLDPITRNTKTYSYEEPLDIVGLNYYQHNYEMEHEMYPDRVWWASETRAIYFYDSWSKTKDAPHILGDFTWTAFDNLGEAGAGRFAWESEGVDTSKELPLSFSPYPWKTCFQGDHDICGYRRPQSYFREAVWLGNTEPRIFTTHPCHFGEGFTGTTWHWYDVRESWTYPEEYEGKDIKAEVYTDAQFVDWYVNGEYVGRSETQKAISSINTKYRKGEIRAVAIKNGKEVSEYTLKSADGCEKILLTLETCQIKADGRDLLYVRVSLTDKKGLPYVTDERHLNCSVTGGKLLAFFSGDPKTEVSAAAPECDTFHGKALAVISTKTPGEITVTVEGDGLEGASVTLQAI